MNHDHYHLFRRTAYTYEFYSDGPKGKIRKAVNFKRKCVSNQKFFNLGFGDWDEKTNSIADKIITNNKDRDKVLATVAVAVLDFITNYPEEIIFATGSTDSRTRLYQMSLARILPEVKDFFTIKGFVDGKWEFFEKGRNYEAFILKARKKLNKFGNEKA